MILTLTDSITDTITYVMADKIVSMIPDSGGTAITLLSVGDLYVAESPEEIMEMINREPPKEKAKAIEI